MDSCLNNHPEPVCRFGPGGDFVSVWPPEQTLTHRPSMGRLTKFIQSLSHIVPTLLGSTPNTVPQELTQTQPPADPVLHRKGLLKYAVKKIDKPAHTASATAINSHKLFSDQSILFPDDGRISIRTGHKPKHRIRAYRRTAKKTPPLDLAGQGSLFESDFKSARTA